MPDCTGEPRLFVVFWLASSVKSSAIRKVERRQILITEARQWEFQRQFQLHVLDGEHDDGQDEGGRDGMNTEYKHNVETVGNSIMLFRPLHRFNGAAVAGSRHVPELDST